MVKDIEHEELNEYWVRFLESQDIFRRYTMVDSWELTHRAGFVTTNRVGKIYFAGAAGGGIDPFLGFGQLNAIIMGVMVGRSIAKGTDINLLLRSMRKKSQELYALRQLLNKATNRDLNLTLSVLKIPGLRSLVYKSNIDIFKAAFIGNEFNFSKK